MKRIIALFSAAIMVFPFLPHVTCAEEYPDDSGEFYGVTWEFDGKTRTLTLSGEGTLAGRNSFTAPNRSWRDYTDWETGTSEPHHVEHIIVNEGFTEIDSGALNGYPYLLDVRLPDSLKTLGTGALANNPCVTEYIIPDGVTSIGGAAFLNCTGLTRLVIPDSVTELTGKQVFAGCAVLNDLTLSEQIKILPMNTFNMCYGLRTLRLPDSIECIEKGCFKDCYDLVIDRLPENLKEIQELAFRECTFSDDLVLPPQLSEIGKGALPEKWLMNRKAVLTDAGLLYSYWNPSFNIVFDEALYDYKEGSLNEAYESDIVLPDTVKTIAPYAFQLGTEQSNTMYFTRHHSLTIPRSVTDIRMDAFFGVTFDEIRGYTGSYAQQYANGNGYRFVPLDEDKDAVKPAYGERTISIENTGKMLGTGYAMNDWHETVLRERNGNNPITIKDKETGWEGSCYGLAVFQILLDSGALSPADFGAETIPEIAPTAENISFINCLHQVSNLPSTIAVYSDQTKYTQKQMLAHFIVCAQKVNAGAEPFLINIRTKGGMHAIAGYGLEYGAWEWDGAAYDRRILVWDSNYISGDERDQIYYNSETMHWCIPAYGLSYAESDSDTGALLYAIEDIPALFDYFTKRIRPLAGDVTADAQLSMADAVLLCRYAAEDADAPKPKLTGRYNMDANADGFIDADDVLFVLHQLAPPPDNKPVEQAVPDVPFTAMSDYQAWAKETGYPQGILTAQGADGINQDYFHTPADSPAYTSGRIVIGDSRCCQLGIWQQRTGGQDFAAFAVWGGHYVSGVGSPILSETALAEIAACFRTQIASAGRCSVYLFATVNDYDYQSNRNTKNISAAVSAAEKIAAMTVQHGGKTHHPDVTVIGFAGGRESGKIAGISAETFNRYVDSYNSSLRKAVSTFPFTTVPDIMHGACGFITDGLHYSDETLSAVIKAMKQGI